MTLTEFVSLIELMRKAQDKAKEQTSVKWLVESKRLERLVDDTILAYRREQERLKPKQKNLFD